jgi:integrase
MSKDYGDGSVYQRKGSPAFWIRFSANGREQRESSKSTDEKVARKLLKRRLAEVKSGEFVAGARSLTFEKLVDILKDDYRLNRRTTPARIDRILRPVREEFGGKKASQITALALKEYALLRKQRDDAANATVLLELSLLRSAFNKAIDLGVLASAPRFPTIDVSNNARQGVFTHAEVVALAAELPLELRGVVWVSFLTGWRLKSDVLRMTWSQVQNGVLRLEPGNSKGGEGRSVSLDSYPQLKAVFDEQRAYTDRVQHETGRIIPFVFHRHGQPIATMRQAFMSACVRAKLEGKIPHDLRRSAARSMDRAGVPRSVAMQIMGLRTENVFLRYRVVIQSDLDSGASKLAELHANRPEGRQSTVLQGPKKSRDMDKTRTIRRARPA